jgi:hypothetical protein
MATLKIADRHVLGPPAALAATAYLAFYLLFTGAIQYTATTPIGTKGIHPIYTYVETTLYTGPLLQIVGDGYILNIRITPLPLAAVLSALGGEHRAHLDPLQEKASENMPAWRNLGRNRRTPRKHNQLRLCLLRLASQPSHLRGQPHSIPKPIPNSHSNSTTSRKRLRLEQTAKASKYEQENSINSLDADLPTKKGDRHLR